MKERLEKAILANAIDYPRLIMILLYSVKTNNLPLYQKCNSNMADLVFAFDGPNYFRYLV